MNVWNMIRAFLEILADLRVGDPRSTSAYVSGTGPGDDQERPPRGRAPVAPRGLGVGRSSPDAMKSGSDHGPRGDGRDRLRRSRQAHRAARRLNSATGESATGAREGR